MVDTQAQQSPGLVDSLKSNFSVDGIINQVVQSKDVILEMGLYGLLGFVVGYLLKRYSGFIVTFAFVLVILIVLGQFQLVTIILNWNKFYELIGIQPALVSTDNLVAIGTEWARTNVMVVASAALGFLIGLRAG